MVKKAFEEEGHEDEMRPVVLPSNALFQVHHSEQEYFTERVNRYLEDNHFTNVSDLQDLDRVAIGELLIWRWGQWLMSGQNYWGDTVDDTSLQKSIKDLSSELRLVKSSLSLDKVSRDRQRGDDSPTTYIENLGIRAEHFHYKRNEEYAKIMEIFHQLKALVTFHDNCDEDERRQQRVTLEHIVMWLRETAFPEYEEIDRKFRQDGPMAQKMWIREM